MHRRVDKQVRKGLPKDAPITSINSYQDIEKHLWRYIERPESVMIRVCLFISSAGLRSGFSMTEFPALREALCTWLLDAAASLMTDHDAQSEGLDLPRWNRDTDGVFRNIARPIDGWDFRYLRRLQQLASWPAVEKVFQEDSRLGRQIDTLVGTIQGGSRVEAFGLAIHIIPRPGELDRAGEIIEQRYAEFEAYLVADELEFKTIWPIPGLIIENMPIELKPDITLDAMSDSELITALRTETVRTPFSSE
jgi:hypothetical protein